MCPCTRLANAVPSRPRCSQGSVRGLLALAVLVAALSGACESPLAPESCGGVPQQVVNVGESVRVRVCFDDWNGDRVSVVSSSSNRAVATVAVLDGLVTVTGVRGGTAMVTVTARDPGGLSGKVSFSVIVLTIVQLSNGNRQGHDPAWSPDGTRIAFTVPRRDNGDGPVHMMNSDGSGVTQLANSTVDSDPVWSPDGSRIAFMSGRGDNSEIYVGNADGSGATNLTDSPGFDGSPAWSPDGTRIAFMSRRDGNHEIYVMNADGSGATNLTNSPGFDGKPAWSPDGTRIAFESGRYNTLNLYVMNADGSGATNLSSNPGFDFDPAWSPDGTRIAFMSGGEIHVMNVAGGGATNLTTHAAADYAPRWSPDGTRIAFVSDRGGDDQIHVMNADGSGVIKLTNTAHLFKDPAWSPDGRKIAFSSAFRIYVANDPFFGQAAANRATRNKRQ